MNVLPHWQTLIDAQQQQGYYQSLMAQLAEREAQGAIIYPPAEQVFSAFSYCDVEQIRVVIIGQDPYHGANQAHGLSFSVNKGIKVPPSLVNIYKELAQDIEGFVIPEHGYLADWAKQGVLLLNTTLTVEQGQANAHAQLGWQQFTEQVVTLLNSCNPGCVFMLWGSHAQQKAKLLDQNKHLILKAPHPSPLSVYRGFFGCQHFSQANAWLQQHYQQPINWQIDS